MALKKIAGSRGKYMADERGLREIGKSQKLGDVSLTAALRGAALGKQYDPRGEYSAVKQTVKAGWKHEDRAGASVRQDKPGGGSAIRHMVMVDVQLGMESGRGSSRIP